jgi:RND family efflux transporter MFP subunit
MKVIKKELWYVILILVAGCGLTLALVSGEKKNPIPHNTGHTINVKIVTVKKSDYQLMMPTWGFVEPAEIIHIRSELAGKIDSTGKDVFKGAKIQKGKLLFSLDNREYLNVLAEAEAANEQAQQALEMEMGWQNIVKKEMELLDDPELMDNKNPLMLRQPQLKELKARIKAAEARLALARLNLEKTRILSPCTGIILDESVAIGRFTDPGEIPIRFACTESYHIIANYSSGYSLDSEGSDVTIQVGPNQYIGHIKSLIPQIDGETRQKQALVEFKADNITIGSHAAVTLPGKCHKNVVVLDKAALRTSGTLWVLSKENTLEIRNVMISGEDSRNICVMKGLNEGESVILSHIASPLQGMKLNAVKSETIVLQDEGKSGGQI